MGYCVTYLSLLMSPKLTANPAQRVSPKINYSEIMTQALHVFSGHGLRCFETLLLYGTSAIIARV